MSNRNKEIGFENNNISDLEFINNESDAIFTFGKEHKNPTILL